MQKFLNKSKVFFAIDNNQYTKFILLGLLLIFFTGIISILFRSPMSWLDEQIHYARSIQLANGDFFVVQDNDMSKIGGRISVSQKQFIDRSMIHIVSSLETGNNSIISTNWSSQYKDLNYTSDKEFVVATTAVPYTPLVYFPYIAAVEFNKILHLNAANEFKLMKLFGFLSSFIMLILAIKITPWGKLFFIAINLIPTTILSLSSITADSYSFAISFLFIAYSNRLLYLFSLDKDISRKELICYLLVSLGLVMAKMPAFLLVSIYLPLMYVLVRNGHKSMKIMFCLISFLLIFAFLTLFWAFLVKDVNTGAYFGVKNIDTFQQIEHILSDKSGYIRLLLLSILNVNPLSMQLGYADNPSYMYIDNIISYLFLLGLIALFFIKDTDKNIKKTDVLVYSGYSVVLYCIITALIFTLLYLQFTPVGSSYIAGVQPRYFIPYLLLLMLIAPNRTYISRFFIYAVFFVIVLPLGVYLKNFSEQLFNENVYDQKNIYDEMGINVVSDNSHFNNLAYAGVIDKIGLDGNNITLIGWSNATQNQYEIHSNSMVTIKDYSVIHRGDVAKAMNNPELKNSGFRIIISINDIENFSSLCLISKDANYGNYKIDARHLGNDLYRCE